MSLDVSTGAEFVESRLFERLSKQVADGHAILFAGAGFSVAAKTQSGENVPGVSRLKELLWQIGMPGHEFEPEAALGEIYQVAVRRAGNRVKELLEASLTVDLNTVPQFYEDWFSMPWLRSYTLNIDNLDEAAASRFSLPRRIVSISALHDSPPAESSDLVSVHLNGRVRDYPDVTFSPSQFAERTAHYDPWYQHLVADISGHPVVFVGTELNEPPLWHYLALRRSKGGRGRRELRPGSYLVVPKLSAAKQALLEEFNISWVAMDAETFAKQVLVKLSDARTAGLANLSSRTEKTAGTRTLLRVSEIRTEGTQGLADFLLGREPDWSDLTDGYAVVRDFDIDLASTLAEGPGIVLITGTAGSGKSTTLRRAALSLQAEGKDVRWFNQLSGVNSWELRRIVAKEQMDVLAIDDVDAFGASTSQTLNAIVADHPELLVLAAARSTRFEHLGLSDLLSGSVRVVTVPPLRDSDIELLIDALARAKRLGRLAGKSHQERVTAFRDRAGRQLLVALLEATTGERFEEKIERECSELSGDQGIAYAVVTVGTVLGYPLSRDEVLIAIGETGNPGLHAVNSLVRQHLLIETDGRLLVRHRLIAERALVHYKQQGQCSQAVQGLLWAMGTKVVTRELRKSRQGRFLTRMLNHAWLIKQMKANEAREAYTSVEELLAWNFHYWLQRGSLEVEVGDLRLAQNFLEQAKSMEPDDYKVRTEWAYMMLKRAALECDNPDSYSWAEEAFAELDDVISTRGVNDSYPYHVYGSQGLSWVRRCPMTPASRRLAFERIRNVVGEAKRYHPRARDISQLADDVEKAYLMQAVEGSSEDS